MDKTQNVGKNPNIKNQLFQVVNFIVYHKIPRKRGLSDRAIFFQKMFNLKFQRL